MNRQASFLAAGGVLAALLALSSGCSLIGLAVDASQQPDTLAVEAGEKSLEGKVVALTLRDGYCVTGECRRIGSLPGDMYRSIYKTWQGSAGNEFMPLSPGDTISIAWKNGQTTNGSLEGFTLGSVVVLSHPVKSALFPRRQELMAVPLDGIDSVSTPLGSSLDGRTLQAWIDNRGVPTMEAMLLRRGETSTWVPLDQIVRVSEIQYSYDWFKTGAIADVAALTAAVIAFSVRDK